MGDKDVFRLVNSIEKLCIEIGQKDKRSKATFKNLQNALGELSSVLVAHLQPLLLASSASFIQTDGRKEKEDLKQSFVETLTLIFTKTRLNEAMIFYNFYEFLITEIYDTRSNKILQSVSEEFKLSCVKCCSALTKSLTWDSIPNVYAKKNVPKLSVMLCLLLRLAKDEQLLSLRIASIESILYLTQLDDDSKLNDLELSQQISECFMNFLPGVTTGLLGISLSTIETTNHKVLVYALRAWGRIVLSLVRNYDGITDVNPLDILLQEKSIVHNETGPSKKRDADKLLERKRDANWYKEQDCHLQIKGQVLNKFLAHSNFKVRKELLNVCQLLIQHCFRTIPSTVSRLFEIIFALSEDECDDISKPSCLFLTKSNLLADDFYTKCVLDCMEHNFYDTITKIPRIFNGIDEQEQIMSLNKLIGYLKTFSEHTLKQVLFTQTNLNRLIVSLIHITQLENSNVSVLEEYTLQDFESTPDIRTPWKNFHFQDNTIQVKLECICRLLSQPHICDIVLDYLIDIYTNDKENRKEATLLINEITSQSKNLEHIKNIIGIYMEMEYWDLQLTVADNKESSLNEVRSNILQLCLQLEGIGKMALSLGEHFQELLLKVLYVVLEKAGSNHPLLRAAGLSCITNISIACGYKSVTDLVNKNTDYFSFYVMRKLKQNKYNDDALNVLGVVMKYSTMDVLTSIADIVDGVLMDSCDKYELAKTNSYLKVFAIFVNCLHKWLNITLEIAPMKTKAEKDAEFKQYQISNLEKLNDDFSDEIMGKTAEEMFAEDMAKSQNELESEPQIEEYKKAEPPMHIKLTVAILKRSLNFLPSKDQQRKIIVLEILKSGVEVLRDWEDELLPIVHEIWSPLVGRFKEYQAPLVINLSFHLLITLGRLSKDFIRLRTIKNVLPSLCEVLRKQAKESHLKDVGSAYRYTQGYKMQLAVLPQLARLAYDIDIGETQLTIFVEAIELYLSCKQPLLLQEAAVNFCTTLNYFDSDLGAKTVEIIISRRDKDADWIKNIEAIKTSIQS